MAQVNFCSTAMKLLFLQLWIILILLTVTRSHSADRIALMAFKSHLSPSGAKVLVSWNDSNEHCNWEGVVCNNNRVSGLYLDDLGLGGTLSPSLGNLTHIQQLHLQGNLFYGRIPRELGSLKSLTFLDLQNNSLEGEIPEALSGCVNMEDLVLASNKLTGAIPYACSLFKNIHAISLDNNMLIGQIPKSLGSLQALHTLSLAHNNLTGTIPISIGSIYTLEHLKLNNNNFSGVIPIELHRLTSLESLHLHFNQFQGTISSTLCDFPYLRHLHLGNNLLVGVLPRDFGEKLPSLAELNLENNQLEGTIPSSICSASNLQFLNLQSNKFTGRVPLDLGNLKKLSTLLLAGNLLQGLEFINSLSGCLSLEIIDLSNNLFEGLLPEFVGNLPIGVKTLMLNDNKINGPIPYGLQHLTNLEIFEVAKNQLSGPIPSSFRSLSKLSTLSLGGNNLSGEIPTSLGSLNELVELDLHENMLSGTLPYEIGTLKNLHFLDLSYNKFSGPVHILGGCQSLQRLYLQHNFFNGPIPNSISSLSSIMVLDLSHNQFSGPIPLFFETVGSLQFLNLSFNALEGEMPTKGIFQNPSHFSIIGNMKLCGGNTQLGLIKCSNMHKTHFPEQAWVVIVVSLFTLLLYSVCFISKNKLRRRQRDDSFGQVVEYELTRFGNIPYVHLHNATNSFSQSNLIGSGGFATVYKACFGQERMEVAVKVFRQDLDGYMENFLAECEILSRFHHSNLVKVLTCCSSRDFMGREFQALVYEYMPNGSLEKWLHRELQDQESSSHFTTHSLNTLQRIDILIDVATALTYLHNEVVPPIAHLDLKPANILLRGDMTACIGDFGLTRILTPSTTTEVKGTVGYLAPESVMGESASTGWDVYSFGIVLLEMFTGKQPTDKLFVGGLYLRKYVQKNYPDSIKRVLDPHLLGEMTDGDLMVKVIAEYITVIIKVGLDCSTQNPNERMNMADVVKVLKAVRADYQKIRWPAEIS